MTAETVDSIKEALTPLMEKLGATGEYAWQLAVRQQYVNAGRGIVWFLVLCGLVFALWKGRAWFVRRAVRCQEELDKQRAGYEERATTFSSPRCTEAAKEDVDYAMFSLSVYQTCAGIVGVALILVAASELMGAIGRFANPEWYALKMLLDAVTGG